MKVSLREHCTWSRTGIGNSKKMSLEAWPEDKQRRSQCSPDPLTGFEGVLHLKEGKAMGKKGRKLEGKIRKKKGEGREKKGSGRLRHGSGRMEASASSLTIKPTTEVSDFWQLTLTACPAIGNRSPVMHFVSGFFTTWPLPLTFNHKLRIPKKI